MAIHNTRSRSPVPCRSGAGTYKPRQGARSLHDHLSGLTISPNSSRSLGGSSSGPGLNNVHFSPARSVDSFSVSSSSASSSTVSSGSRRRIAAAAHAAQAAATSLGADITEALLKQEKTAYSMEHFGAAVSSNPVWASARPAMVSWMTNVVSSFRLSYDTVLYSAMYYFDGALASGKMSRGLGAPAQLQLLALTCLHLAMKIHGHVRIPLANLLAMARVDSSSFGPADVTQMEQMLLPALGWRLHPPSPGAFVDQYCDEIDLRYKSVPSGVRRAVRNMAMTTLLPIIVANHGEDGFYAPPSVQAYAACWIAIESCSFPSGSPVSPHQGNLSSRQAHRLSKAIARVGGNLNARSPTVQDACCRLSVSLEVQQQQQHAQQMQLQQMQHQYMQQQQQQQQYMYGGAPPPPGYGAYSYFTPPKSMAGKKPSPSPATVCADPYFQHYQQQVQARSSRSPCGVISVPR